MKFAGEKSTHKRTKYMLNFPVKPEIYDKELGCYVGESKLFTGLFTLEESKVLSYRNLQMES